MSLYSPETPHATFAGKTPREALKIIRTQELSLEELDAAFDSVFPERYSSQNEDHVTFIRRVNAAKDELALRTREKSQAEADAERTKTLGLAGAYLIAQGIDPETVPEIARVEIGNMLAAGPTKDPETPAEDEFSDDILVRDEEQLMLVTPNGEIVSMLDAPEFDPAERVTRLEWLGRKLTEAKAKKAGLEAERKVWLDKINSQYGPQINDQQRRIDYLEYSHRGMAEAYLKDVIAPSLKTKKPLRSAKVGLLTMAYRRTVQRLDVILENKAIIWLLKKGHTDAIKVEEKIIKDAVTADVRLQINEDPNSGMSFYPGGEDEFSFK